MLSFDFINYARAYIRSANISSHVTAAPRCIMRNNGLATSTIVIFIERPVQRHARGQFNPTARQYDYEYVRARIISINLCAYSYYKS